MREVLSDSRKHTLAGMAKLQLDELSIPARELLPLLRNAISKDPAYRPWLELLADWDYRLSRESAAAGLYVMWERRVEQQVRERFVPAVARRYLPPLSMRKMIGWLREPDERFGADPVAERDRLLRTSLDQAVAELTKRFGPEPASWRYGQKRYKHALIRHPLSPAVGAKAGRVLDVGPVARGGNSYTVNNTGRTDRQPSGGTFRVVIDVGQWDRSLATNSPGQSGDPESPHYRDLFAPWASGEHFPLLFSPERIRQAATKRWLLVPR